MTPPRVAAAAGRLGWDSTETSWQALVARDDIDLIDVCTPGDTHAEIAIAALEAGKHVLCEKPLANTVEEAEAMARAAEKAAAHGVRSMVGFTYRRVPAIALARQLVAEGRLGTLHHVRAQYLQDWIVDPQAPLSWRLDKSKAGSGALGDIGAHIIDLAQFITGDSIGRVSGRLRTFVDERPLPSEHAGLSGTAGAGTGTVTVDDAATFLAEFRGGALGVFEATRFANGRKNAIRIEINGSAGSLAFDFEDMNLLHFFDGTEAAGTAGFRRIVVTEAAPPLRRRVVAARPPASATSTASPTRSSTWCTTSPRAATRRPPSPTASGCSACWPPSRPAPTPTPGRSRRHDARTVRHPTTERRRTHDPTDHPVHRPVGRPAVRGGVPARLGLGLRRPRDRLLG